MSITHHLDVERVQDIEVWDRKTGTDMRDTVDPLRPLSILTEHRKEY